MTPGPSSKKCCLVKNNKTLMKYLLCPKLLLSALLILIHFIFKHLDVSTIVIPILTY